MRDPSHYVVGISRRKLLSLRRSTRARSQPPVERSQCISLLALGNLSRQERKRIWTFGDSSPARAVVGQRAAQNYPPRFNPATVGANSRLMNNAARAMALGDPPHSQMDNFSSRLSKRHLRSRTSFDHAFLFNTECTDMYNFDYIKFDCSGRATAILWPT
ncbi:hypothetical protein EVAR_85267_1 [Eumeta japonica]|uniref:Uncharacterized protein n=1 Tax=Eumeta variegata TaxID=151549 RepID=A0A4C1V8A3_EUMVA|nr:hypothetical protein EVAR_85267_1 [Eumeta japonica]